MKVVLVSPPVAPYRHGHAILKTRCWQPYSLAIVAAGLRERGHDVRLLDGHAMEWSIAETVDRTVAEEPDALVYSSSRHDAWELPTPDFRPIFEFFETLAPRWKGRGPVAVEGAHGTLEPERILEGIPAVTHVVRHEPEEPMLALFDAAGDAAAEATIPDLSMREPGGTIRHHPDGEPLRDLDRLPMPAFDLLPMDRYREHADDTIPFSIVVSSRGCPMPCGYCFKEMFGPRLRLRSVPKVLEELELLVDRYGVRRIFFHDQIFTLNRRRTHELCEAMIERGLPARLTWRCQTRLNGMKDETLDLMRRAGCVEIQTGLESAAPEIQERILKLDLQEFLRQRAHGERIGLRISPNNMIGLPGDSMETVMSSLRFYHRLGIPYAPNFHFPFPRTAFHTEARARGEIASDAFEEIGERAGLIGTSLTARDVDAIVETCARWNRWLRVKQRLWSLAGKTYGSLVPERERGAPAPAPLSPATASN